TRRDATRDTSLIRDDVVPIGARSFEIERPEVFSVGDAVTVFHPATEAWLAAIDGGGTAEDAPWGVGQHPIALARTVTGLDGHRMTLDAPTFTRLDARLSPSYVYHRDRSRTIENVGVENLRVHIETVGPTSETHAKDAIRFVLVENGWASGVTALHFWRAGISVQHSRYVTIAASAALEPHSQVTGARRYNFEVSQSQLVLFIGNRATDARHAYVGNGTSYDSGIVFLDNVSEDAFTSSESHRQWGSGFLWDRHVERGTSGSGSGVAARRLHIGNRGDFGTSHGWACANCVIWNAEMNGSSAVIEKPPTAQNYGIGIQGEALDSGPFVSNTGSFIEGTFRPGLAPGSLYLRQLQDRLAATSIEPPGTSDPIALYPVVPNPLRESGFTRFELLEVAVVRVSVYDALGREVLRLEDGWRAAGSHDVEIEARDLAPGVYTLRLVSSGATATRRFTRLP
ncbi:MAG: T9SS type A sorting domain-containing protein, partial [Bacteroidota bacterium]